MAKRYVRGHLKGLTAEPGTLLGPNDLGEFMVVLEQLDHGVSLGYAQTGDIERALEAPEPRSITEARLKIRLQEVPAWVTR